MNSKKLIILSLLSILLLASCSTPPTKKGKYTDTLTAGVVGISADESFSPIVQQLIDVFENKYQQAAIIPFFVNEVEAVKLLRLDSVRFAIATRKLTENEKESLDQNRKGMFREIKIATDGIAVIVNNKNADSLISVADLRKIMTGKITTWKELNPNSTLGELKLVFDNPNSSTVRFAIDSICKGKPLSSSNLYAQQDNPAVIEIVSQTPGAIGIIGAAWIGNKSDSTLLSFRDDIKVMSVSREDIATPDNSYQPFQAYMALGNYPLTRDVYILLADPSAGLSSGFTNFITSDIGQRIILRSGMVPATQNIRIVNIRDKM